MCVQSAASWRDEISLHMYIQKPYAPKGLNPRQTASLHSVAYNVLIVVVQCMYVHYFAEGM